MGGGGGSSSSSSSQTTENQDNRVVADANALAIGAGANVDYTYTQGLDERVVTLVNGLFGVVRDIAGGAKTAVSEALSTTKTVAERQQNVESPGANIVQDILKSPLALIVGGVALVAVMRGKRG